MIIILFLKPRLYLLHNKMEMYVKAILLTVIYELRKIEIIWFHSKGLQSKSAGHRYVTMLASHF